MYISELQISGYKNCKKESTITFNKGLNILVGENGVGKSTIIDSLRLVLRENEMLFKRTTESDFFRSFELNRTAKSINIDVKFEGLSEDEKVTFLTWCDFDFEALLHLNINNKLSPKGYYKKQIWGGKSKASAFEEETFDCIDCVYLPPLRDAEEKLTNGRKSRLAVLLSQHYRDESSREQLVHSVNLFNQSIVENKDGEYKEIARAREDINRTLASAMGTVFGQSVNLQFSDASFNSILQKIKLVFFPGIEEIDGQQFADVALNSLGYNNLLYIATVFAELNIAKDQELFKVLLIEEPEAHLHPQLQVKLIKYLEDLSGKEENVQIIITTHSPVLTSSVSLDNTIHISSEDEEIKAIRLSTFDLYDSKPFLNRWFDITKSTLLFSKGVIFVEGICEALLIQEFAKIVLHNHNKDKLIKLPSSLEEAGISVININGINFKHYFKLFCDVVGKDMNVRLPIRCAGITDNDPEKLQVELKDSEGQVIKDKYGVPIIETSEAYPDWGSKPRGCNIILDFKKSINMSDYARLFSSPLKTFEYDFAMSGNTKFMANVLHELWPNNGSVKRECRSIIDGKERDLRADSIFIFKHIEAKEVGKAVFSQALADKIKKMITQTKIRNEILISVPKYIENAILWVCGGELNE